MKNLLFFLIGLAATLVAGLAAVRTAHIAGPDKSVASRSTPEYADGRRHL